MNNTLSKVLKYFLVGLLLVAVLLAVVYFSAVGNLDSEATFDQQEESLGSLLNLYMFFAYILAIVATILTLVFAVTKMILDPKSAVKSIASIGVLLLITFIGWTMASDAEMVIPGYKGSGNVPETLKISGMILYTMYLAGTAAVLTLVYAEVSKIFR